MNSDQRRTLRRQLGAILAAIGLLFTTGCPASNAAKGAAQKQGKKTANKAAGNKAGKANSQAPQRPGMIDDGDCFLIDVDGNVFDDCTGQYAGVGQEVQGDRYDDEEIYPDGDGSSYGDEEIYPDGDGDGSGYGDEEILPDGDGTVFAAHNSGPYATGDYLGADGGAHHGDGGIALVEYHE